MPLDQEHNPQETVHLLAPILQVGGLLPADTGTLLLSKIYLQSASQLIQVHWT